MRSLFRPGSRPPSDVPECRPDDLFAQAHAEVSRSPLRGLLRLKVRDDLRGRRIYGRRLLLRLENLDRVESAVRAGSQQHFDSIAGLKVMGFIIQERARH